METGLQGVDWKNVGLQKIRFGTTVASNHPGARIELLESKRENIHALEKAIQDHGVFKPTPAIPREVQGGGVEAVLIVRYEAKWKPFLEREPVPGEKKQELIARAYRLSQ